MTTWRARGLAVVITLLAVWAATAAAAGSEPGGPAPGEEAREAATGATEGTTPSADGVPIAYTAYGAGSTALVFIHCGFCDQSFWRHQPAAFAKDYRVVTLDLAGHGASGSERESWTLTAFGRDVVAVVEALGLDRVVLIGSSLGGSVALEAARLLPEQALAVIAVDTLQDASRELPPEALKQWAQAARRDFAGFCDQMMAQLFHPDADPALRQEVEGKMCDASPEVAGAVYEELAGYDMAAAVAAVQVPIRGINGDLYPVNREANRAVAPGFDAVVMEGVGHFPMLERPEAFNRHLRATLEEVLPPP